MSVYLTIFSKLRYLGLVEIKDKEENLNINNKYALLNTMRGQELGLICGRLGEEQQERYKTFCLEDNAEQLKGPEPMLQAVEFVRFAEPEDIEANYICRQDEFKVLVRAREILTEHNLLMKLVDVEYVLDKKKLFFYFTSEQRVDFRAYVRDLAREFKTRIEMRQIGVRNEARAVHGIASCGRPCCCSYWLNHFTPIGMKMVKEQKMALNPTKISGICGRLMCCLAYEQPNYEALWDRLPPPGTKINALNAEEFYIVESINLGAESVNVRFPSGRLVEIAISEFENFNAVIASGEEWGEDESAKKIAAKPERRRQRGIGRGSKNNVNLDLDDEDYEAGEINNKNKKINKNNKFNKSKKDLKDTGAGEGVKPNKFKFKKNNKGKGKPRKKGE